MKPLYVLLSSFAVGNLIIFIFYKSMNWSLGGNIAMGIMLIFTAIGHFAFTKGMSVMIPDFIPYKTPLIYLTGILEIILAVGLLVPQYRKATGIILIIFLILILPANIKAAIENINYQTGEHDGPGLSYLWIRIPMQILFIAWVFFCAVKN